jgi:putative Holliday junction resolvase
MTDVPFPSVGRLAGIDYGTVRIGVAICDAARSLASPYENYNRRTAALDAKYFQTLAKEERLVGFVIGLPVHMSGYDSEKSLEVRRFGTWLHEVTALPVTYHDERLTSAQAEDFLLEAGLTKKQRKERLDKLAAQLILSAYLERHVDAQDSDSLRRLD